MKNIKWLLLAVLLAGLAMLVVACGGGKATTAPAEPTKTPAPTNTPVPTVVVAPTADQPETLDASLLTGETQLDSYRTTISIVINGTKAGKATTESIELKTEFTRQPAAQHISMTNSSTEQLTATGTIEIYQVDKMQYMKMGDQWITTPVTDTGDLSNQGLITGNQLLQETCGWKKAGTQTVAGVKTIHYTLTQGALDKCAATKKLFTQGEVTNTSGDVYIAADAKYMVQMDLAFEGKNLGLFGGTPDQASIDQGSMEMHYTISDVNQPITIEVPPEALQAGALPEDIPMPADAVGASQVFGMINFTSATAAKDIADFYKTEMPNNGWTLSKDESYGEFYSLEFTKEARTATLMITTDATSAKTQVLITVQGQ